MTLGTLQTLSTLIAKDAERKSPANYRPIHGEQSPSHYTCWTNDTRTGYRDAVNPQTWSEETAALARWEAHRTLQAVQS